MRDRIRSAEILLFLICIIGIVPAVYIAYKMIFSESGLDISTIILLGDTSSIVFAILLLGGIALCVYLGKPSNAIFLVPVLFASLIPTYLHLSPNSMSRTQAALLNSLSNPWLDTGKSLAAMMRQVDAQASLTLGELPLLQREVVKYEFAIYRNGGFRMLTFSRWNGGTRALTSPYATGDYSIESKPVLPDVKNRFQIGGSMWALNTKDSTDECPGDKIRHWYWSFKNGTEVKKGNGCSSEVSTIFQRKRIFKVVAE